MIGNFGITIQLSAQKVVNDFQTRTGVKLSYKPLKDVKINFTPELRFNDALQFDQYLFEGEIEYQPIKLLAEICFPTIILPQTNHIFSQRRLSLVITPFPTLFQHFSHIFSHFSHSSTCFQNLFYIL